MKRVSATCEVKVKQKDYPFVLSNREKVQTTAELLAVVERKYGEETAVIYFDEKGARREVTYRQLVREVKSLARGWQASFSEKKEKVLLALDQGYEWLVVWLALWLVGWAVIPIMPGQSRAVVSKLLARTQTKYVVAPDGWWGHLPRNFAGVVVTTQSEGEWTPAKLRAAGSKTGKTQDERRGQPVSAQSLGLTTTTAGTGEKARLAMWTQDNVLSNAYGVSLLVDGHGETVVMLLAAQEGYSFVSALWTMLTGGTMVLGSKRTDEEEFLAKVRPTFLVATVAQLQQIYQENLITNKGQVDVTASAAKIWQQTGRRLSRIGVMGTSVDEAMMIVFQKAGIELVTGYGLAEGVMVMTANADRGKKPGSVGWPLPNLRLKIDNPDDKGNGEIWVQGPSVMRGYYNDDQRTRAAIRDGWWRTGVIGRVDSGGYVLVAPRQEDEKSKMSPQK